MIYLYPPGKCPQHWIERGLDLLYESDLVPEQKLMPYAEALAEHLESTEQAYVAVVHDGERFHLAIFQAGSTSHHISGEGLDVLSVVGNGSARSFHFLFGFLKDFARGNLMEWISVTHRTGKYTYQSKYYRLGVPYG